MRRLSIALCLLACVTLSGSTSAAWPKSTHNGWRHDNKQGNKTKTTAKGTTTGYYLFKR